TSRTSPPSQATPPRGSNRSPRPAANRARSRAEPARRNRSRLPTALTSIRLLRPQVASAGGAVGRAGRARNLAAPGPRGVAAALVGVLAVLMLVGWGLGELAHSSAQSADLDVVPDLTADRSPVLTVDAHILSLLGSGWIVFPLATATCAGLYR